MPSNCFLVLINMDFLVGILTDACWEYILTGILQFKTPRYASTIFRCANHFD